MFCRVRSVCLILVSLVVVGLMAACTPKPPQSAVDAVASLRRMVSATDVGLNYTEYSTRMIDLKGDVDAALNELPEGELKTEMTLAIEAYVDALSLWKQSVENRRLYASDEPAKSLKEKYSIPVDESQRNKLVDLNIGLSRIWHSASEHVAKAGSLIGQ